MRNYAQGAALQPGKPLLFGYEPSTAPNYAENAQNPENVGLTAKFSRFSEHFFPLQALWAGKQPRF